MRRAAEFESIRIDICRRDILQLVLDGPDCAWL